MKEAAALAKRLLMGVNRGNVPEGGAFKTEKHMIDFQRVSPDDRYVLLADRPVHVPDGSVGVVLDREHRITAHPLAHSPRRSPELPEIQEASFRKEPAGSNLRVSALRALAGNQQPFLFLFTLFSGRPHLSSHPRSRHECA